MHKFRIRPHHKDNEEIETFIYKDDQQIGSILRGDEVPESSYSDGNTSDSLLIPEESILLPDNIDNTADKPESSVMEESKNDEKPNQGRQGLIVLYTLILIHC